MIAAASNVFIAITLALEAETLQGETAQRVAAAAKLLVQLAGIDVGRILVTLSPEAQQTIRSYFAS